MPFRLLSERDQKKLSTSKLSLPLFVFALGLLITFLLANAFHQSEVKFTHENLKSITREFYRSQNLVLNNSILRIQSFSEIPNMVRSRNRSEREVVAQIVGSTMFQRAALFSLTERKASDGLPNLNRVRVFKTNADTMPDYAGKTMSSVHLRRKIKKMLDENLLNTVAVSQNESATTVAFISRSSAHRRDFVVFSSSLEDFLKDWPRDQELVAVIRDSQTTFEVLIRQNKDHEFTFITDPQTITEAQHKNKFLIYSHHLVNESYGISIDWYQNASNRPSTYVLMIAFFGFSISLLTALFLGFILDQNRRIYKLVVSRTEELELAMNQAQEANLAKTRFLANMSHELRTPLNLILGMIELLQINNHDKKNQEYLKNMQTAGEHLLNLITDLLSMSKEEASDVQVNRVPINVPVFFEEIGGVIGPECSKKNLGFRMIISHDIPASLTGDPVKIRQILLNLLRNSLKYTTQGYLALEVEMIKREGHVSNDICNIRFNIRDTGVGIPKNKMNMIFDRFFQIEGSKMLADGGVGLGLSIVKDLVSKMHGNITVKSEVGQGSTFSVDLDLEVRETQPWIQQYHLTRPHLNRVALITENAAAAELIHLILPQNVFSITQFNIENTLASEGLKIAGADIKNYDQLLLYKVSPDAVIRIHEMFSDKKLVLIAHDDDLNPLAQISRYITVINDTPILTSALFEALDFKIPKKKVSPTLAGVSEKPIQLPTQSISVLAVDDDAGNRELLRAYLDSPHFKVSFAKDGQEAFGLYQEKKPDVVVADLRMPVMNGFELADAINQYEVQHALPVTPIILLTADALENTSNEAKKYEIAMFLTKPIRRTKLLNAISEVHQQQPKAAERKSAREDLT